MSDQVNQIVTLSTQNPQWKIRRKTAVLLSEAMGQGEFPQLVVPMSDFSENGKKFPVVKPIFCITNMQIIASVRLGILGRPAIRVWQLSLISGVSKTDKRVIEIRFSDGNELTIRGLIGGSKTNAMTDNVADCLSQLVVD